MKIRILKTTKKTKVEKDSATIFCVITVHKMQLGEKVSFGIYFFKIEEIRKIKFNF